MVWSPKKAHTTLEATGHIPWPESSFVSCSVLFSSVPNVKSQERCSQDFPGDPVVKTLHSQCRGQGFDPWPGDQDPICQLIKKKKRERDADKIEDVPDIHGAGKNLWEYCKSLAGYRKDRVDMMTTVMSLKRYFVMRGSHFFKNWRPVPRNMLFTINLLQDYVSHIICKLITKPVSVTVSFLEINHLGKLVTELYFSFKSKG